MRQYNQPTPAIQVNTEPKLVVQPELEYQIRELHTLVESQRRKILRLEAELRQLETHIRNIK